MPAGASRRSCRRSFVHADPAATADAVAARLAGRTGDAAWAAELGDGRPGGRPRPWPPGWPAWTSRSRAPRSRRSPPRCPDGSTLWAGNSMPVRDMEGWLPLTERAITVRSNRGANGIDGVVSTALGSAAVAGGPVALVVGDVSFLHDLNALVAAQAPCPVRDDRAGQQRRRRHLLVPAPGDGDDPGRRPARPVRGAVRDAPRHRRRADRDGVGRGARGRRSSRPAASRSSGRSGSDGVQVLELRTDRARNVALHREVAAVVATAIKS